MTDAEGIVLELMATGIACDAESTAAWLRLRLDEALDLLIELEAQRAGAALSPALSA